MLEAPVWLPVLLLPVAVGSVYALLCVAAVHRVLSGAGSPPEPPGGRWPPVSILKPIHGLEKDLERNLRSACTLDYPEYQVVLSAQRLDDPALPLLRRIERELGPERVTLSVRESEPVVNGKVQNLVGALAAARHPIVVVSDSDVRLRPDYLKTLVAPFSDAKVGCACTLYRATSAETWYEKLELLSYNAEFVVSVIFAAVTGTSAFCLGCSVAVRRSVLDEVGGLEPLGEYLVEDYELGRRINARGYRTELVPYFVDTTVGLAGPREWWHHQVYWDQNTRAARPWGFAATILLRAVPFALLFAALRGFDAAGGAVLAGALAVRLATAAAIFARIGDREGLASLGWLPLRDVLGVGSWALAFLKRSFVWRDIRFGLTRDGRIVPRRA